MRVLVLLFACNVAHADTTLPPPATTHGFQTHCGERLERARLEVARVEPWFKFARVDEAPAPGSPDGAIERVELTLDESRLPFRSPPFIFAAYVHARRSLWGDDSRTAVNWRFEHNDDRAWWVRQSRLFEAQISSWRFLPSPDRVIGVLQVALDDCLRKF